MGVNAQYNVAAADSLPVRIAGFQREKMFAAFLKTLAVEEQHSILDVGATSDRSYDHSNYLVAWYPHKTRITAVGLDDARFLETAYPGARFVRADGLNLPFADGAFDFVHTSAVIEHVGSAKRQAQFLRELYRVSRLGLFVTTPNRWFPVEFHTVLPLVHWLPKAAFRRVLCMIGKSFFADENNLNLLTARDLSRLADLAGIDNFAVKTVSLAGWPTNLLLSARKQAGLARKTHERRPK
jgi:hypothetical protein